MATLETEDQTSFIDDLKDTLRRSKTIDGYDYNAKKRYYEPAPEQNHGEAFSQVVESRRSVRKFTDKPIPPPVLDACIDLALIAPSSCNLQPWEFHVVQSPDKKAKLVEACMSQNAATTAQELIVVVARTNNWKKIAKLNIEQWPQPKIPRHWKEFYSKGVGIYLLAGAVLCGGAT